MKNFRLIDQIQTAIAVIDKDMTIVEANSAFQQRHHIQKTKIIGSKCFDSAYKRNKSCSNNPSGTCPVQESFKTKKSSRSLHHFWIEDHAVVEEVNTTPIIEENGDVLYVVEEFRDISELLGLNKGIIGICSYCRKIHNDDGQWITFEAYLHKHTGADFSHCICEECSKIISSELNSKQSCSCHAKVKCNR